MDLDFGLEDISKRCSEDECLSGRVQSVVVERDVNGANILS